MKDRLPILVVDDEKANLIAIEYQLKKNYYEVESVSDAMIALELYKINDYSLVLLDVMMPQIDGFELCKQMIAIKQNIPIILITALSDDFHLKKGFECGAWDYINKPWTEIQLISRVKKALNVSLTEIENMTLIKKLQEEFAKQNEELKLAGKVQKYLLPKWIYLKSDLLVSSVYHPSELLGGDIFDIIPLKDNKYIIYIGDISGHGLQAALLMTAVKSIIRLVVEENSDFSNLSYLVKRVNEILVQQMFHNKFLTLLISVVDTKNKTIKSFSAGHPPQIRINYHTNSSELFVNKGVLPLGWTDDVGKDLNDLHQEVTYEDNESFLYYTDGIYECIDENQKYLGTKDFNQQINSLLPNLDLITLPLQIKEYIENNNYDLTKDDVALVNICFLDKYKDFKGRTYYSYETNNEYEFNRQLSFMHNSLLEESMNELLRENILLIIKKILVYINNKKNQERKNSDVILALQITKDKLKVEIWIHDVIISEDFILELGDIENFSISSLMYGNLNSYKIIFSHN